MNNDKMNHYTTDYNQKSVREVVVEIHNPTPVESKFGMLMLGAKYHMLRSNTWVAGYFRLDSDSGPYIMIRADGYSQKLKGQPFRIAHCFYRMRQGALFALFIDFPKLHLQGIPSGKFVLFEMIRGIDIEDERERISDAFNSSEMRICFTEGDGPGEDLGGMWSGGSIDAQYDVVVEWPKEIRNDLNREWKSLLKYHRSLSAYDKDFNGRIQQMQSENPLSYNPILERPKKVPIGPSESTSAIETKTISNDPTKPWWQFRK